MPLTVQLVMKGAEPSGLPQIDNIVPYPREDREKPNLGLYAALVCQVRLVSRRLNIETADPYALDLASDVREPVSGTDVPALNLSHMKVVSGG